MIFIALSNHLSVIPQFLLCWEGHRALTEGTDFFFFFFSYTFTLRFCQGKTLKLSGPRGHWSLGG